ncbi:MAG: hypothetical protein N3E51_02085, partial [Candidatus Micrarchaeota archaeon]|nr:hypothetical protein [Candidatus Micrarchaeota archaeon]
MFVFQRTKNKEKTNCVVLSPEAEQTVRNNRDVCNSIASSDIEQTLNSYKVSKNDRKRMKELLTYLKDSASKIVAILDQGNAVKVPESEMDTYNARVREWNSLIVKYGIKEWESPEVIYFSSTPVDEIVVTPYNNPEQNSLNSAFYTTTEQLKKGDNGNAGSEGAKKKYEEWLDGIKKGEWPPDLSDPTNPVGILQAKELLEYAVKNGRKEEAVQILATYLDGFIALGDNKFFDEIFNQNPELKFQVLASRNSLSSYADYLSLVCEGLGAKIQDDILTIQAANPWILSLSRPEDRMAATLMMGCFYALSNLGGEINKFCEDFGRDFQRAMQREFLFGGAVVVLDYAGRLLNGIAFLLGDLFGFSAKAEVENSRTELANANTNILQAIKNAELAQHSFYTEMGFNVLLLLIPEFKLGNFATKLGTNAAKKELANALFFDIVNLYVEKGYAREVAMKMAADEFEKLYKNGVFKEIDATTDRAFIKTLITIPKVTKNQMIILDTSYIIEMFKSGYPIEESIRRLLSEGDVVIPRQVFEELELQSRGRSNLVSSK